MSSRLWWFRAVICVVRGHVPDGVVHNGDDFGGGGEMWCARRCGAVLLRRKGWTR